MTFGHLNKKSNVEKLSVNDTEINDPQLLQMNLITFLLKLAPKSQTVLNPRLLFLKITLMKIHRSETWTLARLALSTFVTY